MGDFLTRVSAVQVELKAPKGQVNKFGGYRYRSCEDILEAVKPLLSKNKLVLSVGDRIEQIGGRYYICATAILRDTESEAALENSAYAREAETKKGMDESQITGTASSYARKYALNGLLCIDDTKDADTDEYARKTGRDDRNEKPNFQSVVEITHSCDNCGLNIAPTMKRDGAMWAVADIVEYSKARFGRTVCPDCMKKLYKSEKISAQNENG